MSNKKSQLLKLSKTNSGSKTEKELDFNKMDPSDIRNLDYDDPAVLKQFGMEPFPIYDDDMDDEEKHKRYRAYYIQMVIKTAIIESHREKAFKQLQALQPISVNKELENSDDDVIDKKNKSFAQASKNKKTNDDGSENEQMSETDLK